MKDQLVWRVALMALGLAAVALFAAGMAVGIAIAGMQP